VARDDLTVLKPVANSVDHVMLGNTLTEAGLNQQVIANVIQQVRDEVAKAAEAVALGAAQTVAKAMINIHHNTAMAIYEQINALNPAGGMFGIHNQCARIALNTARSRPIVTQ
jgi:hypothetical protein